MRFVPRLELLFCMLLSAAVITHAQSRSDAGEFALTGYVLDPDGSPVSTGRVMLIRTTNSSVSATIDRAGHFRLRPELDGPHQVVIAVPGFAPYRARITLPAAKTTALPVIRLSPATYFRARFVTAAGELLTAPTIHRQSVDSNGMSVPALRDGPPTEQLDADGAITFGPLPWGITMMSVDTPPFAQTRLRDVVVTGKQKMIDGGVITIQTGAVLQVDVVDEHGAPVAAHDVWIEDAAARSTMGFQPVKTNPQGRANFERLGPGRYRLWTLTKDKCGNFAMALARVIQVGNNGTLHERIIIGGQATFRVMSPLGPMNGRLLSARPETTTPPPWQPALVTYMAPGQVRTFLATRSSPCLGATDADGRLTLNNFPPGPATIEVRLFNSTYVKRVVVPEGGREIPIAIPDGLVAVRVTDQRSNQPVANAEIVWTGNGARVETSTTANGDALLEAVGTAAGQLAISAPFHQPLEAAFDEPPAMVQEVALPPTPATRVQAKVVNAAGAPVSNAVVEMTPTAPMEAGEFAVTGTTGLAMFADVPPGTLVLTASAEGFVPTRMPVANNDREAVVIAVSRGYRVIASVEPDAPGQRVVRVFNEKGDSMDAVLDADSPRSFEGTAPISIGPLPPGRYVIELQDARGRRQERIEIVDRNLSIVLR